MSREECIPCLCWHCEKRFTLECEYEGKCDLEPRLECDEYEELSLGTMFLIELGMEIALSKELEIRNAMSQEEIVGIPISLN